jgi:hypothetical protein
MKPVLKTIGLPCLFFFAFANPLFSQSSLSRYEFGVNAGALIYQGDLTPEKFGSYQTLKPLLGLTIGRILSPSFTARISVSHGRLRGDESKYQTPVWRRQRNFSFTSPLIEVTGQVVWSFLEKGAPQFSPYLFTGAGVGITRIKRDYSKLNSLVFAENQQVQDGLAIDAARSLPRVIPVVPVGAGIRYYLNDRLSLTAETSYRFIFTDYLDGFSFAANPKRDDHYLSHSIGLVLSTGSKDKRMGCPVMKY